MTERATRYETVVATLVGVCALAVSGYTAYIQRQQVRAQVLPILHYTSSNNPTIRITVANKGVGPAIVRHVVVKADGQPVQTWSDAFEKLLGPGRHYFSQSTIGGAVLTAGESMDIVVPHGIEGEELKGGLHADPLTKAYDKARFSVAVEICYCSTLEDCWTLSAEPRGASIIEPVRRCPGPSERTFRQ